MQEPVEEDGIVFGKMKKMVKRVILAELKELSVTWVRETRDLWLKGWPSVRSLSSAAIGVRVGIAELR